MFYTTDGKLGSSGSVSVKLLGLTDQVLSNRPITEIRFIQQWIRFIRV